MQDKLQKFEEIVNLLDKDVPSTQEVTEIFAALIEAIKDIEEKYIKKEDLARTELEHLKEEISNLGHEAIEKIRNTAVLDIDNLAKNLSREIEKVKAIIPAATDLSPLVERIEEFEDKLEDKTLIEEIKEEIADLKSAFEEKVKELEEKALTPRSMPFGVKTPLPVTFSFSGDGVTTSFYLPKEPIGKGGFIFAHYEGQWLQQGVHYSVKGRTFSTLGGTNTFTPDNGTVIEGFIII